MTYGVSRMQQLFVVSSDTTRELGHFSYPSLLPPALSGMSRLGREVRLQTLAEQWALQLPFARLMLPSNPSDALRVWNLQCMRAICYDSLLKVCGMSSTRGIRGR